MDELHAVANREITKLTLEGVPDRPGIAAEVFGSLGSQGFNIELVVSTGGSGGRADISLAVSRSDQEAAVRALDMIREEIGARSLAVNRKGRARQHRGPAPVDRAGNRRDGCSAPCPATASTSR